MLGLIYDAGNSKTCQYRPICGGKSDKLCTKIANDRRHPYIGLVLQTHLKLSAYCYTGTKGKVQRKNKQKVLIEVFCTSKSELGVLIIMYDAIGSQGVNLDTSCSKVLMCTAAVNLAAEAQAWRRILRVIGSLILIRRSGS